MVPENPQSLVDQYKDWQDLVSEIKSQVEQIKVESNGFSFVCECDKDMLANSILFSIRYSINGNPRTLCKEVSAFNLQSENVFQMLRDTILSDIAKTFIEPALAQLAVENKFQF